MTWHSDPRTLGDALENLTEENWHRERVIVEEALRAAFMAGFAASAEGWNGEVGDRDRTGMEAAVAEMFREWLSRMHGLGSAA